MVCVIPLSTRFFFLLSQCCHFTVLYKASDLFFCIAIFERKEYWHYGAFSKGVCGWHMRTVTHTHAHYIVFIKLLKLCVVCDSVFLLLRYSFIYNSHENGFSMLDPCVIRCIVHAIQLLVLFISIHSRPYPLRCQYAGTIIRISRQMLNDCYLRLWNASCETSFTFCSIPNHYLHVRFLNEYRFLKHWMNVCAMNVLVHSEFSWMTWMLNCVSGKFNNTFLRI